MKIRKINLAAVLLTLLLYATVSQSAATSSMKESNEYNFDDTVESMNKLSAKPDGPAKKESADDERVTTPFKEYDDLLRLKPFLLNPKDMLLQEIHDLNEEATKTEIDEVSKTLKAEASKDEISTSTTTARATTAAVTNKNATTSIKKLLEDEDEPYDDDVSENEEDESEDEYDDDDEDTEDEEEVLPECPEYCKCAGEYAAATTATCTKFVDKQSFGTGIVHLRIENAGQIRLGPHAFQSMGLQQLESILITDTQIVELNQTAFDGMSYLFSVNLTRNDLQEIHPNTFQNNKQLSFLAISGNPLKHAQDSKFKHGLFDAPSVTEFDFSFNGLTRLKRSMFAKMPSLTYINLKGNKLREIDNGAFNTLESLVEVDLSYNFLTELPVDLFAKSGIETLRIAGNNFTTLSTIQAAELRLLDASNNKIKVIAKDDLSNMPLLDQLILSSNGLKRIHQHAFADLDEMTHLDISDNKLSNLMEHHLKSNTRLQVLIMNDNPELETLPVFKPVGLVYNTYNIYRFECSNCGLYFLEKETFSSMPAITRLNLSKNRLTGLPNGLLSDMLSLRVLDLSDNIIGTLDNDMFRGAVSLTKLSLAGNPLVTLQVTPFLMATDLTKLDVSRCALERVWSEARIPLTSLRYLSVRHNSLRRFTVEELKATPNLASLDLSHNPLDCDNEFKEAVQWLTDHGVASIETPRYVSNYAVNDNYQDSDGISQWTDLAKVVCDGIVEGPPPRPVPHKEKKVKVFFDGLDTSDDDSDSLLKSIENDEELLKLQIDHGLRSNEDVEKAWTGQNQEYEDFVASESMEYQPWYSNAFWPVVIVIIITSMILLLTVHIAIHLAKRRGQGPVIRPPMILRGPGLIENKKNCGLVYKPLQEEIATPHAPKRGSFYSSSTFHYDKIVPESV